MMTNPVLAEHEYSEIILSFDNATDDLWNH
jgi:hypothetical protein